MIGLGLGRARPDGSESCAADGHRAGRWAVDIQKTINIAAPIEQVFGLWARYEQFPFIMDDVCNVERLEMPPAGW